MNEYALIIDPGKKRDSAAKIVLKDTVELIDGHKILQGADRARHRFDVVFLDKTIRQPYPELVRDVCSLVNSKDLTNNCDLLLDATGVGEAVADMMREIGMNPIPIVTTAGDTVREISQPFGKGFGSPGSTQLHGTRVLTEIHVPKQDLVAAGQAAVQQNRVRVAKGLRWAEEFDKQLTHFRMEKNKRTGNRTYEADEAAVHDDLVTCFLIGLWWFTRARKDTIIPDQQPLAGSGQRTGWDPMEFL
jgi:hypothetical protein